MKTNLLNLIDNEFPFQRVESTLSLVPFVRFLKEKIDKGGTGMRVKQLRYVVDRIMAFPGWDQEIPLDQVEAYREVFELIYITLAAPIVDENEDLWALSVPFNPQLFFGTNALYSFLEDGRGGIKKEMVPAIDLEDKRKMRLANIYSLALQKLYGFSFAPVQNEMVHHIRDEHTGLNKYYRLEVDTRFLDVDYEDVLPEINFENIRLSEDSKYGALEILQRFLPLDRFRFNGFAIIGIKDITVQHVLDHIKDVIVNLAPGQMIYGDITASLKELMGNNLLDVELTPVIKLNGRLVTNCFDNLNENMQQVCNRYNMSMNAYVETIQRYSADPQIIFRKNVSEVIAGEDDFYPLLREIGVEGLAVLPIFFQKQLVGILTVYSREKNALNENMLSALEPAIPLLEQLLQTTIDDYNITLDNTVKEKFTSLQPSVEWRFNEIAFDYLQQRKLDPKAEVAQVYFSDVYPLYGAIDIRNSTLERNNALRLDMQRQLEILISTLDQLRDHRDMGLTSEMIFKSGKWLEQIRDFISSDDEFQLNLYFEEEVMPFLGHFRLTHPRTASIIDHYFTAIAPGGVAHNNRRALEESLQMLNRTIGNLLEQMNVEIQGTYPCYFEKFRSDGIEYDIYIGQSITPDREFHPLYLKNLRLWQLNSMAIIARLTHSLQAELPRRLETTQLIFVHANTIDISFRSDEHRFDVEGAYNIRYEMIKKRIDKVLIKDSNERLTQPGKIAMVYFQPKDVEEYLSHIHYLQDQHILADEIEFLELEELQGVNGLKAIRVGVVIPEHAADRGGSADEEPQLVSLSRKS
ncbi:GAF domain-containing protein [Taibaiella helva]|uniref:GAF domain-containing protein n=1 Tax=Taibaiella helva TaxID=2301235 RepID=UPI000E56C17A|nr:GAF domain-containing protein [Taibaiella helva]